MRESDSSFFFDEKDISNQTLRRELLWNTLLFSFFSRCFCCRTLSVNVVQVCLVVLSFCVKRVSRLRLSTVPMRGGRCSRDQGSCRTISQSLIPTQKPPVTPTTEPCRPTWATSLTPGESSDRPRAEIPDRSQSETVCLVLVPPQTRRRGLRVQPSDRILRAASRSGGERGSLLQPILPRTGRRHGTTYLQRSAGVQRWWVKMHHVDLASGLDADPQRSNPTVLEISTTQLNTKIKPKKKKCWDELFHDSSEQKLNLQLAAGPPGSWLELRDSFWTLVVKVTS